MTNERRIKLAEQYNLFHTGNYREGLPELMGLDVDFRNYWTALEMEEDAEQELDNERKSEVIEDDNCDEDEPDQYNREHADAEDIAFAEECENDKWNLYEATRGVQM